MEVAAAMILAVILTMISSQDRHDEDRQRAVEQHNQLMEQRDED